VWVESWDVAFINENVLLRGFEAAEFTYRSASKAQFGYCPMRMLA
jgi:hypothetical protein